MDWGLLSVSLGLRHRDVGSKGLSFQLTLGG